MCKPNKKETIKKGMILINYYGVIDDDSLIVYDHIIYFKDDIFKIDGDYIDDWYKIYCAQAVSIARQGYIVCISPMKNVIDEIRKYWHDKNITLVSISPSLFLKKKWTNKLFEQYNLSKSEYDKEIYDKAIRDYDLDTAMLLTCSSFTSIMINDMNYDFYTIIQSLYDIYGTSNNSFYQFR